MRRQYARCFRRVSCTVGRSRTAAPVLAHAGAWQHAPRGATAPRALRLARTMPVVRRGPWAWGRGRHTHRCTHIVAVRPAHLPRRSYRADLRVRHARPHGGSHARRHQQARWLRRHDQPCSMDGQTAVPAQPGETTGRAAPKAHETRGVAASGKSNRSASAIQLPNRAFSASAAASPIPTSRPTYARPVRRSSWAPSPPRLRSAFAGARRRIARAP